MPHIRVWVVIKIKLIKRNWVGKKNTHVFVSNNFNVSGIGPGWKPSILNSATEFYTIVANMKGQGLIADFYIGGSTNIADPTADFGFADYLPDSTGTCNVDHSLVEIYDKNSFVVIVILVSGHPIYCQSNHHSVPVCT